MNAIRIAAIALIVAGALALAYGGFSYTKETHEAKLGPIELSVQERETVNIPIWAGVAGVNAAQKMAIAVFGSVQSATDAASRLLDGSLVWSDVRRHRTPTHTSNGGSP